MTVKTNASNSWKKVKLSDIADITTGSRDANHGSLNGKYPFFTCAQKVSAINDYSFDTEAILIAGNGDFSVKYYKGKFDAYQRTYVLSNFENSTGPFLYQKLKQALEEIVTNNQGSSVKFIKKGDLTDYRLQLPPLLVQQKISEILSTVDNAIEKTDQIIQKTEKLKQGLMDELLTKGIGHKKFKKTKLGEIPVAWKIVKLENIAYADRGKFSHRPRNDSRFYGGDIPFIQTGDVVNSNGRIKSYSQTLNEKGLSVSKMFPKGTIVITIAANIGDTGILEFNSCFPDSLVGIQPFDVNPVYLEYFLRTRKSHLNSIATQSAQKNINLEKLRPLLVAVPEKVEQEKIASILSSLDERASRERDEKLKLEVLKRGLMQDIFNQEVQIS